MIKALFVQGFATLFILGALSLFSVAQDRRHATRTVQQAHDIARIMRRIHAAGVDTGAVIWADITNQFVSSRLITLRTANPLLRL